MSQMEGFTLQVQNFRSSIRHSIFLIIFIIQGCVHESLPEVFVNSVGLEMDNKKSLLFIETNSKNESLEDRIYRQKLIKACKAEGIRRGFEISSGKCDNCYEVFVTSDVKYQTSQSYMPSYSMPLTTNCSTYGSSTNCISYGGNTVGGYYYDSSYFLKMSVFMIYSLNTQTKTFEQIRSVGTSLSSSNMKFSETTAEYLCRGFFAGFNSDVSETFVLPPRNK